MAKTFRKGDRVSWNSEAGRVSGKIVKVHTKDVNYKGYVHNAFWENQSFHNYADYALSQSFRCGLARLRALGDERRCAVMCAEAVWWRCHRRIIADYLLAAGEEVFHILGPDRIELARMSDAANVRADGALVYGAQDSD